MSENSGAGEPGDGMEEALAACAGCGRLAVAVMVRVAADVSAVVPRWKKARLPILLWLVLEVHVASLLLGISCSAVLSTAFEEDNARGRWGADADADEHVE